MKDRPYRPIKVMHIIARMNVGGPAVEITQLMRGLDPNIISQRLVTGFCNDYEADFLETQAFDVAATRINGLGRTIRPTDDAKALATLIRLIQASRPDIVHTHTAKAGVLGRIAARATSTGTKVIHTHHGHLLYGYFGPGKTRALVELERQLSKITDRIVSVGDKVRDDLLEAGIGSSDQSIVIRSGVRLGPLPNKQTARRELGLPGGSLIVSMIGRLTRIKRPDRFADVVEITTTRGLGVRYLVAGGGDQDPYLRARIERDALPITMLGWRNDLERILAASDMLILTSDNEGTPLSLIQAGCAGVPVIATHVGAVPEIVEDGITGILCRPEAAALADAVEALSRDQSFRNDMGRRAKERTDRRHEAEDFLVEHEKLYSGLI